MNSRDPRRWWITYALALSLVLVGLDTTVLNVALPTLAQSLHAATADLQWIVDAFILALAGLLLPAGTLADRFGRRRTLVAGLVLFTGGSVVAAWSGSVGALVAARAVMGAGAAVIMTVSLAVVTALFDDDERPKAIAAVTVAMGLGLPLGPIVGGWLLDHYWWGSVFLINGPLGVVAVVSVLALLPESRDPAAVRTDVLGAALSTAGLVSLVYAVVEAPVAGWTSARVLGFGAAGLALSVAFVAGELRTDHPIVDVGLVLRPRFGLGTLCATLAMFAMLGMLFVLPLYLQVVRGHTPLGTGVRMIPMIAGLVVGAKAGEALTARFGNRVPVIGGLKVIMFGLLGGSTIGVATGYAVIALWLALIGVGMGLAMTPAMDAALGEVPVEGAGAGSSLTMALRQVGGALGVAVLGSVLNAAYAARLDVTGLPAPVAATARESVAAAVQIARATGDTALAGSAGGAYVHGMSAVMLTSVGLALLGVVAALFLPPRGATTDRPRIEPESATIHV